MLLSLLGAENHTDRRFFAGLTLVLAEPALVGFLLLTFVSRLELAQLELDSHKTPQHAVIEGSWTVSSQEDSHGCSVEPARH